MKSKEELAREWASNGATFTSDTEKAFIAGYEAAEARAEKEEVELAMETNALLACLAREAREKLARAEKVIANMERARATLKALRDADRIRSLKYT